MTCQTHFTAPIPLGKPRDPAGRFSRPSNPAAIVPVVLAGFRIGFQVGPGGRIYDRRDHAKSFATTRITQMNPRATQKERGRA